MGTNGGRVASALVALTLLGAAGARAQKEPATPALSGAVGVAGTIWSGTDSQGEFYTWRFLDGGMLSYTTRHGTWSNCLWQQQGARVTWTCNNRYSSYDATIAGDRLTGTAHNIRGLNWSYSLTRQQVPGTQVPSPGVVNVSGTVWSGTDSDGEHFTWRFRPGGVLNYSSSSGTWTNGSWRQEGARLVWETNNHYADYDGTISGNQLTGTARNVRGRAWSFSLTLQVGQ